MTPDPPPALDDSLDGDSLPRSAVRISPAASAQALTEYDRLTATQGTEKAEEWREGLRAAWASLATLPLRCPLAPENAAFQSFRPGPPLRVFLYRHGRAVWRLLFTAHAETADDPPIVQVHQLRHAAQEPLTEWPGE